MESCTIALSLPDEDSSGAAVEAKKTPSPNCTNAIAGPSSPPHTASSAIPTMPGSNPGNLLEGLRSLADWTERSKLSTWLYRLAANHAIDRWRAQKRRLRRETPTDPSSSTSTASPLPTRDKPSCDARAEGIDDRDPALRSPSAEPAKKTLPPAPLLRPRLDEIAERRAKPRDGQGLLFRASQGVRLRLARRSLRG